MSANVKIGQDTLNNVDSVRLQSADTEGEYVSFIIPSGNKEISTLSSYDVRTKATARISSAERAKIIPENIADGVTILGVTGTHQGGGSDIYSITCNVTNGTYFGSTKTLGAPNTAQVTISNNAGYTLPSSISVSGASYSYDYTTGIVTITNAIGDVTITAVCSAMQTPYISINGTAPFTLSTYNNSANWDGVIEYSSDGDNWSTWDGTSISSIGNVIFLRGSNNTTINNTSGANGRFVITTNGSIDIDGNIENLLDYNTVQNGGHPTMASSCFANLFSGCTSLTTAPALPATMMKDYCYGNMFDGCTSLTTAPALQATTLSRACYQNMFNGCTSLETVPALPATTLTNQCYQGMFNGCTKIKISETSGAEYVNAYRIPTNGDGTSANYSLNNMFASTGGSFSGTPTINTTYYTSNDIV